jgi:hypothetical protein
LSRDSPTERGSQDTLTEIKGQFVVVSVAAASDGCFPLRTGLSGQTLIPNEFMDIRHYP